MIQMMIRSNSCDKDEGVDVTDEEAVRKAIKRVKSDGGVSILSQSGHGDCLQSFHNSHVRFILSKYYDVFSQLDSSYTNF